MPGRDRLASGDEHLSKPAFGEAAVVRVRLPALAVFREPNPQEAWAHSQIEPIQPAGMADCFRMACTA